MYLEKVSVALIAAFCSASLGAPVLTDGVDNMQHRAALITYPTLDTKDIMEGLNGKNEVRAALITYPNLETKDITEGANGKNEARSPLITYPHLNAKDGLGKKGKLEDRSPLRAYPNLQAKDNGEEEEQA